MIYTSPYISQMLCFEIIFAKNKGISDMSEAV